MGHLVLSLQSRECIQDMYVLKNRSLLKLLLIDIFASQEPSIMLNIYYPVPKTYTNPGPVRFSQTLVSGNIAE